MISVRAVARPGCEPRNQHYASNLPPLLPSPFAKLPIGAIEPAGWLRRQLELMAEGMTGRLEELSKWCRYEGSAWASPRGEGQLGWEELPYWLKGFGDLGCVLADGRIIAAARRWIEAALASQQPDGWFGPQENRAKNDVWPNMILLNVLQSFHEATGDARVAPFMARYFRWQLEHIRELLPGSWQKIRGGDNLASVHWLYNRTGEPWLLELAESIHQRTADWTGGIPTWHGVNICQGFREPAQYYQQSLDPRHLQATERNYDEVMRLYGQAPGGMFGADENCRPGYGDPRQAAETCSMVEFMLSNQMLLAITGDPLYADRCEDVAFNSFPAAWTPDLKALHYLTAPNMIQLDRESKSPLLQNKGDMLGYDPWRYRCCQHNVSHGWPYYAEHLWLATAGDGLAAVLYAPCALTAKVAGGASVKIVEETSYPFEETVRFTFAAPERVRFPLALRIPGWCRGAKLTINGHLTDARPAPLSYLVVEREWQDSDCVRLELPMSIELKSWPANRNAVSVHRGPLSYSLRIGERWVRYGGTDSWPAYEVFPAGPWNYGLAADAASFRLVQQPLRDQPFALDNAPIQLVARAKRLADWRQEANGLVGLLPESPARSSEAEEEILLIPMGCARLRISAFPSVG